MVASVTQDKKHTMTKKAQGFMPREHQPVVEIVQQSYQPSKAELEADRRIKGVTFKQAIQTLMRPVRIRRVKHHVPR